MLTLKKDNIYSLIFILLYILPFPIFKICSNEFVNYTWFVLIFINFILMILDPTWFNRSNFKVIAFASVFIVCGFLMYLIKHTAPQNFLIPFMSIYAYHSIKKFKFNVYFLDIVIISFYIFYYLVYFSILPNLLIHPPELDANLFIRSSSNSIAITLNILLYIYVIIAYLQNAEKKEYLKLSFFAAINTVLILIQQSRAGIMISVLLLFIILYQYIKNQQTLLKFKNFYIILFIIIITVISMLNFENIKDYLNIIGSEKAILTTYAEDTRSSVLHDFFSHMSLKEFIIGYRPGYKFGSAELLYTYNTFLEVWNNYSIFVFGALSWLTLRRCFYFNKYYFPIYFLFPFLIYSIVEPIFLPNYWDFSIYLILFKKNILT